MDNNEKICNNCKKEIKEKKTRKRKDPEENKFGCTKGDECFTKKSEYKKLESLLIFQLLGQQYLKPYHLFEYLFE